MPPTPCARRCSNNHDKGLHCSLRLLARLLAPCSSLSVLDLGYLRWSGSSLKPLLALPALHSLTLICCRQLSSLDKVTPLLARLTSLQLAHVREHIWGDGLPSLHNLEALSSCTSLQVLKLPPPPPGAPARCGIVLHLTKLTHLELHLETGLFPVSSCATRLVSLELWSCQQVVSLPPLLHLGQLTRLGLHSLSNLTTLAPLASLSSLQDLELEGMSEVGCLQPLSCLTRLTCVDLMWEDGFVEGLALAPLVTLTRLKKLVVDAYHLEDEVVLGMQELLEHLTSLPCCHHLTTLMLPLKSNTEAAMLARLTALERLKVTTMPGTRGCTGKMLCALSSRLLLLVSLSLHNVHDLASPA